MSAVKLKDTTGIKLGMWLFLFTELLLFGGLFVLYAAYLSRFTEEFVRAGQELSIFFGTLNTAILLISSFLVAAALTAARTMRFHKAMWFVALAILLGTAFLLNKYIEWGQKFAHDLYPGSKTLLAAPPGEHVFFGLYYIITGLHGLHVIVGMLLLAVCWVFMHRGKIKPGDDMLLENSALYWHLVDLIWIFVFPLFYLII